MVILQKLTFPLPNKPYPVGEQKGVALTAGLNGVDMGCVGAAPPVAPRNCCGWPKEDICCVRELMPDDSTFTCTLSIAEKFGKRGSVEQNLAFSGFQ